jgi:hypothetical protein
LKVRELMPARRSARMRDATVLRLVASRRRTNSARVIRGPLQNEAVGDLVTVGRSAG